MCRIANADEFIEKFPNGFDTHRRRAAGGKLSCGQQPPSSRSLGRSRRPRILILDEATQVLDSDVGSLIQEAPNNLRKAARLFVICPPASTIRSAPDPSCRGRTVLERGTHEQLIALDARYQTAL